MCWSKGAWVLQVLLAGLLALGFSSTARGDIAAPVVADGSIDLRSWDPQRDGPVSLAGDWGLYWAQLVPPDALESKPVDGTLPVPGPWSGQTVGQTELTPQGTATYRLKVLLPEDQNLLGIRVSQVFQSHRLWVDGVPVTQTGRPGPTLQESAASDRNDWGVFAAEGPSLDIVMQVSNHRHRRSGLRAAPILGTPDQIANLHDRQLTKDLFMTGCLFLFGILHLITYLHRRRQKLDDGNIANLWFSVFCMGFALQTLMKGETWIFNFVPNLSWDVSVRCRVLLNYSAALLYVEFCTALFPGQISIWLRRFWHLFVPTMAVLIITTPASVFSLTFGPFSLACLITMLYLAIRLGAAWRGGTPGAGLVVISVAALGTTIFIDTLTDQGFIQAPRTLLSGLFIFLLCQSFLLAQRFTDLFIRTRSLSTDLLHANQELGNTNAAALRFVPVEFLRLLKREQLVLVERGDHVQTELEVLFCDIRKFTTILEGMPPQEAFAFINSYLREMEPQIYGHGGFINQYLGDCIMALFHGGADQAVRGGIAMLDALDDFNKTHGAPEREIHVGVGINSGPLMMGTIGGMDRLDGGVIGDDVNLASRIEGMTKMYGTRFLISESTHRRLEEPERFSLRELDQVVAKGKSQPVRIYEVLDGLRPEQKDRKLSTLDLFYQGTAAYRGGRFADGLAAFQSCLDAVPEDGAASLYVERCQHFLDEPPERWSGVTVLTKK